MDTAQLLLSQGNATAQSQAKTAAVTSAVPWIVLGVVAVLVVIVFLRSQKK